MFLSRIVLEKIIRNNCDIRVIQHSSLTLEKKLLTSFDWPRLKKSPPLSRQAVAVVKKVFFGANNSPRAKCLVSKASQ